MTDVNEPTELSDWACLMAMALALEAWFPRNNGPFSYGTRLCEEIGELVDALEPTASQGSRAEREKHLVKEAEDVLQIVAGVMHLYDPTYAVAEAMERWPAPSDGRADTIAVTVAAGALADAINHMEGQGIKGTKHGDRSRARLEQAAQALAGAVAAALGSRGLLTALRDQMARDYVTLQDRGLMAR